MIARLASALFPARPSGSVAGATLRMCALLFIAGYGWQYFSYSLRQLGQYSDFLHGPNLIIHEAGHVIFGVLGNQLLTALGGSLLQVLLPFAISLAFLVKNRDAAGAAIGLWWTGQNLVDVSPYINDARMLSITLIGGRTGREVEGHDWEFILTELDLLSYDIHIARWVLLSGRIIMAAALAWGLLACLREFRLSAHMSAASSVSSGR